MLKCNIWKINKLRQIISAIWFVEEFNYSKLQIFKKVICNICYALFV